MESGTTSISKVTVEYHDPSGVFPLISRQLQSRLPLRDLHWKSPTRPLRSIDFLHVDLTPSRDAAPSTPQSRQGTPVPGQDEGTTPSSSTEVGGQQGFFRERRHQIPGLRQTPYVKVYLLRCDDNETYKASSRKALREWWKVHTPPSQSSSSKNPQENHDAFERLIVHVILPNTGAACQPRSSGSSSRSEGGTSEKPGGSSRLLSRSNTIFEKIKADLNVSNKSASDRVAQLRLQAEDIPQSLLPAKPTTTGAEYEENPQERADSWRDIVVKLKTLILSSFDLRVREYEEDIRERDAQRTLPGWNFCTFFVLKEGLARGFESVGLVDDALIGYDELSLGLDNAIQEQQSGSSISRSDSFLSYTKELKDILVQSQPEITLDKAAWDSSAKLISSSRKGYRDMILASNISVFDFKCYIFARQMTILLRMGILHSSELASLRQDRKPSTGQQQLSPTGVDDFGSLSELCRRAASFIAAVSRIMRDDLGHAEHAQKIEAPTGVIDNIVASWAFGVAEQILDETNVPTLPKKGLAPQNDMTGPTQDSVDKSFHPARSSSLSHRANTEKSSLQGEETALAILDKVGQKVLANSLSELGLPVNVSDTESLAGHRAELYVLQRQIMERVAEMNGWSAGLNSLRANTTDRLPPLKEVDLDNDGSSAEVIAASVEEGLDSSSRGVCQATLMNNVSTTDHFKVSFEEITNSALTNFLAANRINSIERLVADLALIKFDAGDFVDAANYLNRITPSYADRQWGLIETSLLKVHAQCLKKLNRRDDYARMLLNMLAKTAAQQKSHQRIRLRSRLAPQDPWQDDDHIETNDLLAELVTYSADLPYDLPVSMKRYFTDIAVKPYIQHFNDTDGFSLELRLRHLLGDDLEIESTKVRLTSVSDGPTREIWLISENPVVLKTGMNNIRVGASITSFNTFVVDRIVMKSKRVSFEYDPVSNSETSNSDSSLTIQHDPAAASLRSRILCYPKPESFDAKISLSRSLHIDKIRTLEIQCSSGWNTIRRAEIHLRSASAGLRLRTADAKVVGEETSLGKSRTPGVIDFVELAPGSVITIQVPYDLEDDLREISIRLDVTYFTPKGKFEFLSSPSVTTELPIDVNVHDFFKASLLFSRFQIRSSRGIPLHIFGVNLDGTDQFSVQPPPCAITPMVVFTNQPATVVYKIMQKSGVDATSALTRQAIANELPLTMTIDYGCVDEYALVATKTRFNKAVAGSQFAPLGILLTQTFADKMRRIVSLDHFSKAALLRQVHIPSYQSLGWNSLIDGLPTALGAEISPWLQAWHSENRVIPLPQLSEGNGVNPDSFSHRITMNVPLPRLHILQTVSLSFPKSESAIFSTGSLIPATVTIKHTRRWDSPTALKAVSSSPNTPLEFIFEVDAPSDVWLIGGQRRTKFLAKEDEVKTWTIMIMPLKVGRLLLPTVDTRAIGKGLENISCETDSRSLGDTVIVIGDLGSTTVELSEGPTGTEAVMTGSEKR